MSKTIEIANLKEASLNHTNQNLENCQSSLSDLNTQNKNLKSNLNEMKNENLRNNDKIKNLENVVDEMQVLNRYSCFQVSIIQFLNNISNKILFSFNPRKNK